MGSGNSFSIFALTKSGPLSFFSMVLTSKLIASFLKRQYCLMCKPNSFHNRLYVLFSFGYALFSFGYALFSFGCASFTFRHVIISFGYALFPFGYVLFSFNYVLFLFVYVLF